MILFADSNRGQFIPQHFAEAVSREYVTGVTEEQFATLAKGPYDNESYWDCWTEVMDSAVLTLPGTNTTATLYSGESGDLWVCTAADYAEMAQEEDTFTD